MKIYKQLSSNFTIVSNSIFSCGISLKAIGLYAYIVSKPDNWSFSVSGTATQMKDGVEAINSGISELESVGLLTRKQARKSGKFSGGEWYITDKPCKKECKLQDFPSTVSTVSEKTVQVNTNKVSTKNINTYVGEYITKYNELYRSNSRLTKSRQTKYSLRLKAFSHEDIMHALELMSKQDFFRGLNDRGWIPDPDYLIRSDENVDRFIAGGKPINKTLEEKLKEAGYEEM